MRCKQRRRGTIYLMVLSTTIVVTVLSLTGITLVRVQRRGMETALSMIEARGAARSGLEFAAARMDATPGWRAAAESATGSLGQVKVGRYLVNLKVADPVDASLSDSSLHAVEVTATAVLGATSQSYKAKLVPAFEPHPCLAAAITVDGDAKLEDSVLVGTGYFAGNSKVDVSGSRVWMPVRAVGQVSGSTFYSSTSKMSAVAMPTSVYSYYTSVGVQIPLAQIPGRCIQNVVLSPDNNPYSTGPKVVNSSGVYWINCGGQDLTIRNCRVLGTLVLINCNHVHIENSVSMAPASRTMPALLVQGKGRISTVRTQLSEATVGVNFNPEGSPFGGVTNTTMVDSYPSMITGLVYFSGNVELKGGFELIIDGLLIVADKLTVDPGSLGVAYDSAYFLSPPPGFTSSAAMKLEPGSVEQVVN